MYVTKEHEFTTKTENKEENERQDRKQAKKKQSHAIEQKWIVLAAGFVFTCFVGAIPFQLSIIYVEFLEEFGASYAETSLVQSVCSGIFYGGGFISGMLVNRFGVRVAGTVSGILTCLGLSLSFVAMNIPFLVVTIGVISGSGFSIGFVCSSSCVGQHFIGKSKHLALSVVAFGAGAGSIASPYMFESLIQEYGWRGTFLIIGGMTLNLIPSALVSIPPSDQSKTGTQIKVKSEHTQKDNGECQTQQMDRRGILRGVKFVLKNKLFLLYSLGLSMTLSALLSGYIFFIDVLLSKGLDRPRSVFVLLICNTSNALSRFIPGLTKQIPHISVLAIPVFYFAIGCVTTAVFPLTDKYEMLLLVGSLYGLTYGGAVTTISVSTVKLIGIDHYPIGLGIFLSLCSIGVLSGGPISGKLRDISGSYDLSFYTVSGALGVACIILTITTIWRKNIRIEEKTLEMEIVVGKRMSRKRSSIIPWKRTLEFVY